MRIAPEFSGSIRSHAHPQDFADSGLPKVWDEACRCPVGKESSELEVSATYTDRLPRRGERMAGDGAGVGGDISGFWAGGEELVVAGRCGAGMQEGILFAAQLRLDKTRNTL